MVIESTMLARNSQENLKKRVSYGIGSRAVLTVLRHPFLQIPVVKWRSSSGPLLRRGVVTDTPDRRIWISVHRSRVVPYSSYSAQSFRGKEFSPSPAPVPFL